MKVESVVKRRVRFRFRFLCSVSNYWQEHHQGAGMVCLCISILGHLNMSIRQFSSSLLCKNVSDRRQNTSPIRKERNAAGCACRTPNRSCKHSKRIKGYLSLKPHPSESLQRVSLRSKRQLKEIRPASQLCRENRLSNEVRSTTNHLPFMQSVPTVVYNVVTCFHNNTSSHESSSSSCSRPAMQGIDQNALKMGIFAC